MTHWQPYPEYKDSGVPWLGQIPVEWRTTQIKYGYEVRLGKMLAPEPSSSLDTLKPYLRAANVYWEGADISDVNEMWFSPSEKAQYRLEPGDLVVCEGGDVGRCAIWKGELPECYIQNAVHRVRGKDGYSNKFLYYWLFALKSAGYIDLICSKATIAHLTAEKLAAVPLVVPSSKEQRAIAAFLDHQTAKIDALTAEQRRLIELLQEHRAALISHTVTKGLDPDVPMKDSGIEWLGQIPEHWEVAPVYARYLVQLGKMLDQKQITGEYLHPYLRNIDVQWDQINTTDLPEMDFPPSSRARFVLRTGDLLVCEGGEPGRSAIWRGGLEECYYQKALHRLRPHRKRDLPRFLYYVMCSAAKQGMFIATGNPNTIDHLTAEKLRKHRFAFPPVEEQHAIAAHLDRETAKIDALLAEIETGIAHLEEYRTALISTAVTGKIDVRSALPPDVPAQPRLTDP